MFTVWMLITHTQIETELEYSAVMYYNDARRQMCTSLEAVSSVNENGVIAINV
jgi:hypothetical protein